MSVLTFEAIAQQGDNEPEVKHAIDSGAITFSPLMTKERLITELSEYGAWDEEELSDHVANVERIVWIAAHNLSDELFDVESDNN